MPWSLWDAVAIWAFAYVAGGTLIMSLSGAVAEVATLPLSVVAVGATTVAYVGVRYGGTGLRQLMGDRRAGLRDVVAGTLHGAVAFAVFNLGLLSLVNLVVLRVQGEVPQVQEGIRQAADSALPLVFLSSAAILAPIGEELFFRGVVMTRLRDRFGRVSAILLSSVIFTVVHYEVGNPQGSLMSFIGLFPLAIYLAIVFDRRRNLVAVMTMHASFNALGVAGILATL